MLSHHLSHVSVGNENSLLKFFAIFFAGVMKKLSVPLSEQEKSERIEFICFLLPLVVTVLGIIIMLVLYKIYM